MTVPESAVTAETPAAPPSCGGHKRTDTELRWKKPDVLAYEPKLPFVSIWFPYIYMSYINVTQVEGWELVVYMSTWACSYMSINVLQGDQIQGDKKKRARTLDAYHFIFCKNCMKLLFLFLKFLFCSISSRRPPFRSVHFLGERRATQNSS